MRNVMIFAALMVGFGTVMAQIADRMTTTPAHAATAAVASVSVQDAPRSLRSITIPRDTRGHFQTEARIEAQRLDVMVDTGAAVTRLNERFWAPPAVAPSRSRGEFPGRRCVRRNRRRDGHRSAGRRVGDGIPGGDRDAGRAGIHCAARGPR